LSVCPLAVSPRCAAWSLRTLLEPVERADEVERLLAPRLAGEHARQVLEALPAVIGWATFEDAALIRRAFEDVGARRGRIVNPAPSSSRRRALRVSRVSSFRFGRYRLRVIAPAARTRQSPFAALSLWTRSSNRFGRVGRRSCGFAQLLMQLRDAGASFGVPKPSHHLR
jgi:hypothetical protein